MKLDYLLLFLCYILVSYFSFSQNYVFKEYGVNDGLPSSQVYDIYQDKNGYIWFATDRGLVSFNGYEFKKYGVKDGLPGNVVLTFSPQPNGEVWCSAFNQKLFYFNEDFDGFHPYQHNAVLANYFKHPSQRIESVYIDEHKNVHLGTVGPLSDRITISSSGKIHIFKINKNEDSFFNYIRDKQGGSLYYYSNSDNTLNAAETFKLPTENSFWYLKAAYLKKSNRCVFLYSNCVLIVNSENQVIKKIVTDKTPLNVSTIDDSHFVIGYRSGGAHLINSDGKLLSKYLDNQSITSTMIDHEGGFWFTTLNSGIYYLKNHELKLFNSKHHDKIAINSLTKNNDDLFIGYENGDIVKLDQSRKINDIVIPQINYEAKVEYSSYHKSLFYYTNQQVNFLNDEKKQLLLSSYVLKFSEPVNNSLLISSPHYFTIFDNGKIRKTPAPFRIHDACYWKNLILIGSPKGLFTYNTTMNNFSPLQTSPLLKYRIEDIDANPFFNEVYLATLGAGLVVHNDIHTYSLNTKNGLLSDLVNEVYIEDQHTIWAGTNGGVNKISFTKNGAYNITGLNNTQGLISDEVKDLEIIKDTVWIGTKKGLMYIPKSFFNQKKDYKGTFSRIKNIAINDSLISNNQLNMLSHKDNYVSFFVEAISFKKEGNITYHYKLDGLNDKWYTTKNRNIHFSSLAPGDYTFTVTSCAEGKNCHDHLLKQSFKIAPPFWLTWWFRIIIILIIGTIIYFFFKVRILSYNRDITRELLRLMVKRLVKKEQYLMFREAGQDVRIKTSDIFYVKSSSNYVDIVTEKEQFTIRQKIGEFIAATPDPLEYIRIHRSFIIRLDKIRSKSKNEVIMVNGTVLPVSKKYIEELNKIHFPS